ncbi:MAG: DUF2232 domain-containing protein [Thiotrichales bacterium]
MIVQSLGKFILAGLPQAVLATVGFAVLALAFPPLSILSGTAIALVTLRFGHRQALLVMAAGAVLLALGGLLKGFPVWIGVVYAVVQWAPVVLLAALLRGTTSWTLTVQVAIAIGLVGVFLVHAMVPDVASFWEQRLSELLRPVLEQAGEASGEMSTRFSTIARHLTGVMFASTVLGGLVTLMLARSIQAQLFNPGGFRSEFHALRLGTWPALVAIAVSLLTLVGDHALPSDLALVLIAVFALQGLAVVHATVARQGLHRGWLIGVYALLVLLLWPMALLLSGLGIMDAFADFRRRFEGGGSR